MNESTIWIFLFGMISVYPFFPLRHVPVMDRLKIPFWKLMLYASFLMLIQGLSYAWLAWLFPFGSLVLAWHRKLFMIPYVLLTLSFSKDSKSKTLFMDFFMVAIVMAVIDCAYILDRTVFAQYFALAPHRTDVLIRLTLTALLYPPLCYCFKKDLRPIMKIESLSVWRYMTAIPFVFALISIITTMEAFNHSISIVIVSIRFSVIVGSILVSALLAEVMKQMESAAFAEEKSKHAEWLLALQRSQYDTLTKNFEQTRAARHDLCHHLTAISTMAERKEYDELVDFVNLYHQSLPSDKDIFICENYAANSVISHYIALAHTKGIASVDVRCVLEQKGSVKDTDLCVLFGNLLENAIEGCMTLPQKKRQIKLRVAAHGQELLVTVDNTFDGILFKEQDAYLSRKRKGTQQGVGLSSVAAVIEKYNGRLKCEQKDGWFLVSAGMRI